MTIATHKLKASSHFIVHLNSTNCLQIILYFKSIGQANTVKYFRLNLQRLIISEQEIRLICFTYFLFLKTQTTSNILLNYKIVKRYASIAVDHIQLFIDRVYIQKTFRNWTELINYLCHATEKNITPLTKNPPDPDPFKQ